MAKSKTSKTWGVLKRLGRSSFLYIVVLLALTDLCMSTYVPKNNLLWYERSINGCNEPFCRKIFEYICSKQNPQVIMLGSSLLAVPSLSCDHAFINAKGPLTSVPDIFAFSHYKKSEFFKLKLHEKLGQQLDVANLGVAGIVASDQDKILAKAFEYDKKPSLIVWTIAPAEFIWNDGHAEDATRIGLSFKSYTWPVNANPVVLSADKLRREVSWHLELLENELAAYKAPLSDQYKQLIHRADPPAEAREPLPNPAEGVISKMDAYGRQNRLEDIPNFNMNYAKATDAVLSQQLNHFDKALALCDKNHVQVVVVNMPITSYNRNLIKKSLYDRYMNEVTAIAQKNNAPLVDMDHTNMFELSDFYDSTHLNETGGKKLFGAVADKIANLNSAVATRSNDHPL